MSRSDCFVLYGIVLSIHCIIDKSTEMMQWERGSNSTKKIAGQMIKSTNDLREFEAAGLTFKLDQHGFGIFISLLKTETNDK
jgi:hypothetical protein